VAIYHLVGLLALILPLFEFAVGDLASAPFGVAGLRQCLSRMPAVVAWMEGPWVLGFALACTSGLRVLSLTGHFPRPPHLAHAAVGVGLFLAVLFEAARERRLPLYPLVGAAAIALALAGQAVAALGLIACGVAMVPGVEEGFWRRVGEVAIWGRGTYRREQYPKQASCLASLPAPPLLAIVMLMLPPDLHGDALTVAMVLMVVVYTVCVRPVPREGGAACTVPLILPLHALLVRLELGPPEPSSREVSQLEPFRRPRSPE